MLWIVVVNKLTPKRVVFSFLAAYHVLYVSLTVAVMSTILMGAAKLQ